MPTSSSSKRVVVSKSLASSASFEASSGLGRRGPAGLHHQVAAILIEDVGVVLPRSVNRHAAGELGRLVQPFEHADVGIGTKLIAGDRGVGKTHRHFVVTGIGKRNAVGHVGVTTLGAVAEYLALLRHRAPDEWEQQLAALLRRLAPVAALQFRLFDPVAAVLGIQQQGSAPWKTSCHRNPSLTIKTTFCVFVASAAAAICCSRVARGGVIPRAAAACSVSAEQLAGRVP